MLGSWGFSLILKCLLLVDGPNVGLWSLQAQCQQPHFGVHKILVILRYLVQKGFSMQLSSLVDL